MKKWIILVGVLGLIGLMVLLNLSKNQSQTKDAGPRMAIGKKAIEVEAMVIEKGSISSSVLITGTVKEQKQKDIVSESPLKLTGVYVKVGQKVNQGDVMFDVDFSDLMTEIDKLKVNLEIQELNLQKLTSLSSRSDETGLEVALELAKLSLGSAERYLASAQDTYEKNRSLYEGGVITLTELETSKASVEEANNQLVTASLSLERSEADLATLRKNNNMSVSQSAIDEAIQQKNIESLQMSIASLEEQVEEIKNLAYAPMAGVVTLMPYEAGDQVMAMSPILQITDLNDLIVKASIREYDVADIKLDQEVIILGDAISKDIEVKGIIGFIAPIAAETIINGRQATAIELEITITEGVEALKPGYNVECEIITSNEDNILVANYEMLTKDQEGRDVVYLVKEDMTIEIRPVILGITSDFTAEIKDGLSEGDRVVMSPSLVLKEGSLVKYQPATKEGE